MSRKLILLSLLILLISACARQVTPAAQAVQSTQTTPSNTVEAEPTLSIIAAWTELALTKDAIVRPTLTATDTAVATSTAEFALCPGAPGPYVALGNQVTVVSEDTDTLKLRSGPEISPDNVLRDLNRFTQMTIVGGPVCVHSGEMSYWFWQVRVDGETGWVAEGDVNHRFIAVRVGGLYAGSTATAYTATTPLACQGPHAPIGAGVEIVVITPDSDKLKLRSEPEISPDTVLRELDRFTRLKVIDGPVCVQAETGIAYWLWKVQVISSGQTGWVAEGDGQNNFIDPILPP
jgi:hypothetical protein